MGCGVRGFPGSGFGLPIQVSYIRFLVKGFRGGWFGVRGFRLGVGGLGFRASGSGFRVRDLGFQVSCGEWGSGVSRFGFRVTGSGFAYPVFEVRG